VWAFDDVDHSGNRLWYHLSGDFTGCSGAPDGIPDGVYGSPALADVDGNDGGKLEIIYGGWDAYVRVLNHDGSLLWEKFVRDTIWSSPAIGDIDRDGKPEIVIGSDAHLEPGYGTVDGGKIYAFNGENGSILPGFFKQVDEVIWSSPALGDIDGDGWLDIVVGTGDCYEHAACAAGGRVHAATDALYAWDHEGNPLSTWTNGRILLSEFAFASPALGDLDGDGDFEIVINTDDGYVHAFNADGTYVSGWPRLVTTPGGYHFASWASPILADLTGDAGLEVILPSNWEIVVWDRNGNQLTPTGGGLERLDTNYTVGGTPAAGDVDGDGKMELVVGGAGSGGSMGAIYIWDFSKATTDESAPWPSFRKDNVNHARHAQPPVLLSNPTSLLAMHEYGSGPSESSAIRISNAGDGEIAWEATAPPTVTLGSYSGTVDVTGETIGATISVGGYITGTHDLGTITVTGTIGGEEVNGSPAEIPVTLYVGTVHRVYLPVVLRGN
jgi:hypothetical protein